MNGSESFSCIIPTLADDYNEVSGYLYSLFDMTGINRLIFIGPESLGKAVYDDAKVKGMEDKVRFINENDIIPFDSVKRSYETRMQEIAKINGNPEKVSRVGWYYQQFLKMAYSRSCPDEYYLCWDADTIPLRRIEMFHSSGKPYLDIKPEYRASYFETIKNLFGYGKVIRESFISEHMLFDKKLMIELMDEIMSRPLEGSTFYEKIFSALDHPLNGFSEFETYGTWIAKKYPDKYRLRHWKSLRNTGFMINRKDVSQDDLDWLATGFDAASFERYQEVYPHLNELFLNRHYREKLTADVFYKELLEMGLFGEYKDGGIVNEGYLAPI